MGSRHSLAKKLQAQPNSARKQGHGAGDRQTIMHETREEKKFQDEEVQIYSCIPSRTY